MVDGPTAVLVLVAEDLAAPSGSALVAGAKQRCAGRCNPIPGWCRLRVPRTSSLACCVENRYSRAAWIAARRRSPIPSILPKCIRGRLRGTCSILLTRPRRCGRAAPMASTISGGSAKRTFSGINSISSSLENPCCMRKSIASCTRTSGAEAPAVRAIVFTPSSHS